MKRLYLLKMWTYLLVYFSTSDKIKPKLFVFYLCSKKFSPFNSMLTVITWRYVYIMFQGCGVMFLFHDVCLRQWVRSISWRKSPPYDSEAPNGYKIYFHTLLALEYLEVCSEFLAWTSARGTNTHTLQTFARHWPRRASRDQLIRAGVFSSFPQWMWRHSLCCVRMLHWLYTAVTSTTHQTI